MRKLPGMSTASVMVRLLRAFRLGAGACPGRTHGIASCLDDSLCARCFEVDGGTAGLAEGASIPDELVTEIARAFESADVADVLEMTLRPPIAVLAQRDGAITEISDSSITTVNEYGSHVVKLPKGATLAQGITVGTRVPPGHPFTLGTIDPTDLIQIVGRSRAIEEISARMARRAIPSLAALVAARLLAVSVVEISEPGGLGLAPRTRVLWSEFLAMNDRVGPKQRGVAREVCVGASDLARIQRV